MRRSTSICRTTRPTASIDDGLGLGTILDDDDPVPTGARPAGRWLGRLQAPDTTITAGPKAKTKKKKTSVRLQLERAGRSSFECKLDGGNFQPCTSPQSVKVKKGTHTFQVRAIDAAGNVDPSAGDPELEGQEEEEEVMGARR